MIILRDKKLDIEIINSLLLCATYGQVKCQKSEKVFKVKYVLDIRVISHTLGELNSFSRRINYSQSV